MILSDILSVLQNDVELQSFLGGTTADKKIYAFSASKLNSIAYDFVNLTSNKIVGQARLTLTINTTQADLNKNLQIVDRVKQLLLTLADNQFNTNVIEIQQNGGGILTNNEISTIHNKLIFSIKYRERI